LITQEAEGADKLLEALQKLPGFDNDAVIKAMSSTSNAKIVCWKRNVLAGVAALETTKQPPPATPNNH
jgi:hypothetical protein